MLPARRRHFRVISRRSQSATDQSGNAQARPAAPPRPGRCALLVFVRAPRLGRVKTRLAAGIGEEAALEVYRRLAERTVRAAVGVGEGVEVRVHVAPGEAIDEVRAWLGPAPRYLRQADGDLGERMRDAFDRAFADGCERVVIVGSDLPGVSTELLLRAMHTLSTAQAVLGPARDGGYYLLGLRSKMDVLFSGIAWSTSQVFAATVERLRAEKVEPAILETLADVDEPEDLPAGWREEDWLRAVADPER